MQITVRLNAGIKNRSSDECDIELKEGLMLSEIIKQACKTFNCKENYKIAKLYNKNGI